LLLSMFLLGIFVGKQMEAYPERFSHDWMDAIRNHLVASVPKTDEAAPPAEAGKQDVPAGGEESFGLTFYETLGGKKDGSQTAKTANRVKDQSPESSAPVSVPAEKPALPTPLAGPAGGTSLAADSPISGEVESGKKTGPPTEKKATVDGRAKVPPIPAGAMMDGGTNRAKGRFQIQVAAYQESGKADLMMEKLNALGFASLVTVKDLPGKGRWFRVIVSGFESREKAKAAADQIADKLRGVKCVILSVKEGRN
jgi:cell division protein FtsN